MKPCGKFTGAFGSNWADNYQALAQTANARTKTVGK
jgi:hypothetical protein